MFERLSKFQQSSLQPTTLRPQVILLAQSKHNTYRAPMASLERVVDICRACNRAQGKPCTPCIKYISSQSQALRDPPTATTLAMPQQVQPRRLINASHDPYIHRFPLEISAYIFELSLPSFWDSLIDSSDASNKSEISTPLALAAVCSTWREIAFSVPRLWTTLAITLSFDPKHDRLSVLCELVQQWIKRSRNLPLSIWVGVSQAWMNKVVVENKKIATLLSILNDNSGRWKNLHVDYWCEDIKGFELSVKPGVGAPILDGIKISDANLAPGAFGVVEPKPSPTFVSTYSVHNLGINWEKLTDLEWEEFHSLDEFLYIIVECAASLVNCTLWCDILRETDKITSRELVVCPKLQSLKIFHEDDGQELDEFLPCLTSKLELPELVDLELSFPCSLLTISTITDLLSRTARSLTSLSSDLGDCIDEGGDAFAALFQEMPNLIHFKSKTDAYMDITPLFVILAETFEETPTGSDDHLTPRFKFVPHLESFSIQGVRQDRKMTWKTITDIFGSVAQGNPVAQRPLKKLTVDFGYAFFDEIPSAADVATDDLCTNFTKKDICYIGKEDFQRFLHIGHSGVDLHICLSPGEDNELRLAAEYHNIAPQFFN